LVLIKMARPGGSQFRPKTPTLNQRQRELWWKLNAFVMQEGGRIISEPDASRIRFECGPDSGLPDLLRSAGHNVRGLGRHERLIPSTIVEYRGNRKVTTTSVGPGVVAVFEFSLPLSDPKPMP
jgi:hypothetical protein